VVGVGVGFLVGDKVGDSEGNTVGDSVGDSVRDLAGDSVDKVGVRVGSAVIVIEGTKAISILGGKVASPGIKIIISGAD